jgi:VIT1/CCC1 family predicted Fe2+/Mn2+ transporter
MKKVDKATSIVGMMFSLFLLMMVIACSNPGKISTEMGGELVLGVMVILACAKLEATLWEMSESADKVERETGDEQ